MKSIQASALVTLRNLTLESLLLLSFASFLFVFVSGADLTKLHGCFADDLHAALLKAWALVALTQLGRRARGEHRTSAIIGVRHMMETGACLTLRLCSLSLSLSL